MQLEKHPKEADRLASLRSFQILDTPREEDFDAIVDLAAFICDADMALVCLIDEHRQWFKAEVGFGVRETSLDCSICSKAILQNDIFEIEDCSIDDRFRNFSTVAGPPNLRFYAGTPLTDQEGLPIGTLCVFDKQPKRLSQDQRKHLRKLGRDVMSHIHHRRNLIESERMRIDETQFLNLITEKVPLRIAYLNDLYEYEFVNENYAREMGLLRSQFTGLSLEEVIGRKAFEVAKPHLDRALNGEMFSIELDIPYSLGMRTVAATYIPRLSAEGRVKGVIGCASDITLQKETERKLLEEKAWIDTILGYAQIGTWTYDPATGHVSADSNVINLFNLSEEQAIGATSELFIANLFVDDRFLVAEALRAAVDNGQPFQTEFRVGEAQDLRWIVAKGFSQQDPLGKVVSISGVLIDITANKTVREREEAKFRALLDRLPANIAVTEGENLRITYANPAYVTAVGRELVGKTLPEAFPELDGTAYQDPVVEVMKTGESIEIRSLEIGLPSFPGPDKTRYYNVLYQALVDESRQPKGVLIHGQDITIETRATKQLQESEARFRQLVELSPATVWFAETDGNLTYISPDFYKSSGLEAQEVLGLEWMKTIHPKDLGRVGVKWESARRREQPYSVDFRMKNLDGEYRWINAQALPVRSSGGEVIGWLGSNNDIHEHKTIEEQLQAAVSSRTEELQLAVREAEAFNYSISHDLRAPLRAIIANASILLEELGPDVAAGHRELLERQKYNARRLASLIDELLRLSRLARVEVNRRLISLSECAEEIVQTLQTDHRFEIQEGMSAQADPELVYTVLENLFANAAKFSPAGSVIQFGEADGVFFVRDTGIGFSMEYATRMFLPFERLVSDEEFPGTGIGLANVMRIVERHRGMVWAESVLGNGATFYFTLSPTCTIPAETA